MTKKQASSLATQQFALLWGTQTQGGRSGLQLKTIVEAAITIADQEGLDALSMRHLAEQLEVGTMSLYTHVPGKNELIELMIDTAYGELYPTLDAPTQAGEDWHGALRHIARRNWELYRRHSWMLSTPQGRRTLGPHAVFKYEAELRPLDLLGLTDIEMDATLTLILTHVEGCARSYAAARQVQQTSGETDAEWWVTQEPILERMIDPKRFPVATRVGSSSSEAYGAASNPEFIYEFGLERILEGISALIASKRQ